MAQNSYSINLQPVAYAGQKADSAIVQDVLSVATGPTNALPYGLLCVVDQTNSGDFTTIVGKLPSQATDITALGSALGVVLADQGRTQDPTVTLAQYSINSAASVMKTGRVYVYTEGAVTMGAGCYVRFGSGAGGTQPGSFRADADTATAALLPNAVFKSTTTGAGYAVVELNLV